MDLLIERDGQAQQVTIDLDERMPVGALLDGLIGRQVVPAGEQLVVDRTGMPLRAREPVSTLGLRHGDRLRVGSPTPPSSWRALITEGPHAGRSVSLTNGRHILGRDRSVQIPLARDGEASRQHAALDIAGSVVSLTDLGSANGTTVNAGPTLTGTAMLRSGDTVRVGRTVLVLTATIPSEPHLSPDATRVAFRRSPLPPSPPPPTDFPIPEPPAPAGKQRLPMIAALGPLALGAVLFLLTRQPTTLVLILLSPMMMVGSAVESRRGGKRAYELASEKWVRTLRTLADTIAETHQQWLDWRRTRHPDLRTISRWGLGHAPETWHRLPAMPTYGELRLGVAEQVSPMNVVLANGGEETLRAMAQPVLHSARTDPATPVVLSLAETPVVALSGDARQVLGLARSLVLQAAVLHSPRFLPMTILSHDPDAWSWASWLPHLGDEQGRPRVVGPENAAAVVDELSRQVTAAREANGSGQRGPASRAGRRTPPSSLLVVHPPMDLPAAQLSTLLAAAGEVGLAVLWIAGDSTVPPAESQLVVDLDGSSGTVTTVESGAVIRQMTPEWASGSLSSLVARSMAPLRDDTADGAGGIPTTSGLLDLLALPDVSAKKVGQRWMTAPADTGKGLPTVLGSTASGAYGLPLFGDENPHALIGGTAGAGKSALLLSLVASLAVTYPPRRLSLLLVDFKGGSAFGPCVDLPHTAGLLTNLDPLLAGRVLDSLRAEVLRRQELLAPYGGDLAAMIARDPAAAPPRMVLVFDEFAQLAEEIPDFVDGIVKVAALGRSLGVHVVLATQSPGQHVKGAIQANVTTRIALRVADSTESQAIIGRSEAARIPKALPGRAYAATEVGTTPTEFQSAFVGGRTRIDAPPQIASVWLPGEETKRNEVDFGDDSDLARIVRACREAAVLLNEPQASSPWQQPLPELLSLESVELLHAPLSLLAAPIGIEDRPDKQDQVPLWVDLAAVGNVAVYGALNAGVSTTLRSIAGAFVRALGPDELHLYGIDAGTGLGPISTLPHSGGVARLVESDRVRRLFTMLEDLVEQRRDQFAATGADGIASYTTLTGTFLPSVLLVIDGFAAVWETLADWSGDWASRLRQLFNSGPEVGLHVIAGVERAGGMPMSVRQAFGQQLAHRMGSIDEDRTLGLTGVTASLGPGGVLLANGHSGQIGVAVPAGCSPGITLEAEALQSWAALHPSAGTSPPRPLRSFPTDVTLAEVAPEVSNGQILLGVDERTVAPVVLDLAATPVLLVAGSEQSGRTSALQLIAEQHAQEWPSAARWLVAGRRRSSLAGSGIWSGEAVGPEAAKPLLGTIRAAMAHRMSGEWPEPHLLVVDDGDLLGDVPDLEALVMSARDAGLVVVASSTAVAARGAYGGWLKAIRNQRTGLLLGVQPSDGSVLEASLAAVPGVAMVAGRGYAVSGGRGRLLQVARPRSSP
jgi:S-DNA-T family DNA segregation ATPase FtsK/SpoIIIE